MLFRMLFVLLLAVPVTAQQGHYSGDWKVQYMLNPASGQYEWVAHTYSTRGPNGPNRSGSRFMIACSGRPILLLPTGYNLAFEQPTTNPYYRKKVKTQTRTVGVHTWEEVWTDVTLYRKQYMVFDSKDPKFAGYMASSDKIRIYLPTSNGKVVYQFSLRGHPQTTNFQQIQGCLDMFHYYPLD